jgi:hypothetical protein
VLIRGTKRLLAELEVKPRDPGARGAPAPALMEWYGNLILIDRRKCLVFADVATLFTFMIPGVVKKQYRDFRGLFLSHLRSALADQGLALPDSAVHHRMVFGPTRDRRVLGSLNDLVFLLTHYIATAGGLANADLGDAIRRVNQAPMTLIDDSPDRAIRRRLSAGRHN